MFVFKILLILLIAAPVIGIATYFYFQMVAYIREKNRIEEKRIKKEAAMPAGYSELINAENGSANNSGSRNDGKSAGKGGRKSNDKRGSKSGSRNGSKSGNKSGSKNRKKSGKRK